MSLQIQTQENMLQWDAIDGRCLQMVLKAGRDNAVWDWVLGYVDPTEKRGGSSLSQIQMTKLIHFILNGKDKWLTSKNTSEWTLRLKKSFKAQDKAGRKNKQLDIDQKEIQAGHYDISNN